MKGLVFRDGRIEEDFDFSLVSEIIEGEKNLVWLDVSNPTQETAKILKEEFGFHPLSLEDALKQGQRPKIDEYPGYDFLVIYGFRVGDSCPGESRSRICTQELHLFIGKNYLVSVHRDEMPSLEECRKRIRESQEMLKEGIGFLVYSIMDTIIDGYFPILDLLDDEIEEAEERVFENKGQEVMEDLFILKKDLLVLRRGLSPTREIFNVLIRRDRPFFTPHTVMYFQDVYDHLLRVIDSVDLYRDMLTGVMEAHLSVISNRMNSVMKSLTVVATILMSLSLITGVYGMNFEQMPGLHWPYSFSVLMAGMGILSFAILRYFRKIGWW